MKKYGSPCLITDYASCLMSVLEKQKCQMTGRIIVPLHKWKINKVECKNYQARFFQRFATIILLRKPQALIEIESVESLRVDDTTFFKRLKLLWVIQKQRNLRIDAE